MSDSLIPYNIFTLLTNGFSLDTIAIGYFDKMQAVDNFQGNKIMNIFYFFIAWPKVIYISYIVYKWEQLTTLKKIFSSIIILIPVLSGISAGTNKPVFDFVLIFVSSLLLYFISNKIIYNNYYFLRRKLFLVILFLCSFFALYFFSLTMQSRNVDNTYVESTSTLGDIKVKNQLSTEDQSNAGIVWLTNYLVQGYYGFSLGLNQDFTSTFGFGNSPFLSRQFEWITGINLRERTFQFKIDNNWGETAQWHSFYSQFANDFHFIGVGLVVFLICFFMAITWKSIILFNSFYGKLLMPIYFIIFNH
jgi:hypothetical protein